MSFVQPPPALGNPFDDDRLLRGLLARSLPADAQAEVEPALRGLGELAGGELHRLQLADRRSEPILTRASRSRRWPRCRAPELEGPIG